MGNVDKLDLYNPFDYFYATQIFDRHLLPSLLFILNGLQIIYKNTFNQIIGLSKKKFKVPTPINSTAPNKIQKIYRIPVTNNRDKVIYYEKIY